MRFEFWRAAGSGHEAQSIGAPVYSDHCGESSMSIRSSTSDLNVLLARRAFGEVLALTDKLTAKNPRDTAAWHARARAALGVGRLRVADDAADRALRFGNNSPDLLMIRAVIDNRLGRSSAAIDRLLALIALSPPNAIDVTLTLADALHRTARHEELEALIATGGAWLADPRAAIFTAPVTARRDPLGTIQSLETIARGNGEQTLRRLAGFEAVRILDSIGEYRRAFELASHIHASTGQKFDVDGMIDNANDQLKRLERVSLKHGSLAVEPRAPTVDGVALVVGMPRSGTTLLEQMLDRHPDISGIGEYEGVSTMGSSASSTGFWPSNLELLDRNSAKRMQDAYLEDARVTQRHGSRWIFDKSLNTWQYLPLVAAILPGAICFYIQRDPRDTATSLFLSNFHRTNVGWTRSLEDIRRVISAERALVARSLVAHGISHETIIYEDLVDNPSRNMVRCLTRMGLSMDKSVLSPESSTRTVMTLSHEQVRKPINRSSIGRWKNYEWAFTKSWGDAE